MQNTSVVLDAAGAPHISYFSDNGADLKYAHWTGASWAIETVDTAGRVGLDSSLALDASGRPHLAYTNRSVNGLRYARWNGCQWAYQTVESGTLKGLQANLKLDAASNPHISYCTMNTNLECDDLKYARWTGSAWAIQTVDSVAIGSALAPQPVHLPLVLRPR